MSIAVMAARQGARALALFFFGLSVASAAQPGPADLDHMSITAKAALHKKQALAQAAKRGLRSGDIDQQPPVVTAVNAASQVNADRQTDELKVTLSVTDDLSGLESMLVVVRSPSGRQTGGVTLYNLWGVTKYSGTVGLRLGPFAETGEWSIESVSGRDVNQNSFWCGSDCLSQLGGNHHFTVRSSVSDTVQPSLVSGKILTPEVDLSKPAKGTEWRAPFTRIQVTLGDEGGSGVRAVHLTFCSEMGDCFYMNDFTYQYGQAKARMLIGLQQDQWSINPGLYELSEMEVWDHAGNSRHYTSIKSGGETDFSQFFPTTTVNLKVTP